jgi:hypothetical protein
MSQKFDINSRVKIKENAPQYPGQKATITRLGFGNIISLDELEKTNSWKVQVDGYPTEIELAEEYLELIIEVIHK